VEASDGRLVADGAVWSSSIVEVKPGGERGVAFAAVDWFRRDAISRLMSVIWAVRTARALRSSAKARLSCGRVRKFEAGRGRR
jgi:hypothetical protein